jgi:hypothetical protein
MTILIIFVTSVTPESGPFIPGAHGAARPHGEWMYINRGAHTTAKEALDCFDPVWIEFGNKQTFR